MTKVGKGINPVHLSDTAHPFEISTKRGSFTGTSKFARTVGVGPTPGGSGNFISANASMKKKRPLDGPGDAK